MRRVIAFGFRSPGMIRHTSLSRRRSELGATLSSSRHFRLQLPRVAFYRRQLATSRDHQWSSIIPRARAAARIGGCSKVGDDERRCRVIMPASGQLIAGASDFAGFSTDSSEATCTELMRQSPAELSPARTPSYHRMPAQAGLSLKLSRVVGRRLCRILAR